MLRLRNTKISTAFVALPKERSMNDMIDLLLYAGSFNSSEDREQPHDYQAFLNCISIICFDEATSNQLHRYLTDVGKVNNER